MRHQCKRHRLGRPQDQRKALLRSLASSLLRQGERKRARGEAEAVKPYGEQIMAVGKKGDVRARRQAVKLRVDQQTGKQINLETNEVVETTEGVEGKFVDETVLRKLFNTVAKANAERNGGYTRIYRLPPRRGDAAEMALIQLV